ncbi:DUF975 family protein [Lachnospiraceae bacterium KK002]
MERTSAELKRLAREKLTGHWGLAIGATLLMSLIATAVLIPFYVLFLFSGGGTVQFIAYMLAVLFVHVIVMIMQCGITRMLLGFARNQDSELGMLFGEFTRRPDRYILATLMIFGIDLLCVLPGSICWSVGILQGSVLANIIGFVLYLAGTVILIPIVLRFNLTFFLLVDNTRMGALEALRESSRLMDGNKGRMFYLYLTFIGWSLLGMCSCGLGMLWITPYMNQTMINFYLDVTGELDRMEKSESGAEFFE